MASFLSSIEEALSAAGDATRSAVEIRFSGRGGLASRFDVTGLAAASIGAAGAEIARFEATRGRARPCVEVDRRLASMWFGFTLRPMGWTLPSPWDPIAGDYRARDGWIRLHTNAPRHRAAALRVLGVEEDRARVTAAVAGFDVDTLEQAVVEAGGCAAKMRSRAEWAEHAQGLAVAREPLIAWRTTPIAGPLRVAPAVANRPLARVRVLDLTRVLAGPVATRFLAAFGAEVLRIDPPDWDEPAVVPEVTVGKRCAGLDLESESDRARLAELVAGADVLVHGYRPGALAAHGFDDAQIRSLNPDLVDVALSAYGWSGPLQARRGFDSLVQMSSGIADAGRVWAQSERPTPLPVQALDHATGYLMATAALRGLALRATAGVAATARVSLARTAALLLESGDAPPEPALAPESEADLDPIVESTDWGAARRVRFPVTVGGNIPGFDQGARALRCASASWAGVASKAAGYSN